MGIGCMGDMTNEHIVLVLTAHIQWSLQDFCACFLHQNHHQHSRSKETQHRSILTICNVNPQHCLAKVKRNLLLLSVT